MVRWIGRIRKNFTSHLSMSMLLLMMPSRWQNVSPRREVKTGGKASALAFYGKKLVDTSVLRDCFGWPFNLLSDISFVQFVASILSYNFEFCTSTLTAQTPKEGHDKFSKKKKKKLKSSTVALAHILRLISHKIFVHTEDIFHNWCHFCDVLNQKLSEIHVKSKRKSKDS